MLLVEDDERPALARVRAALAAIGDASERARCGDRLDAAAQVDLVARALADVRGPSRFTTGSVTVAGLVPPLVEAKLAERYAAKENRPR